VDNTYILKVENFILHFTSIVYEALPFIILGAVIAGVLEEMLPQKLLARILPRSRTLAIIMGSLLGLVFPMCECGIIPVMRRLLRKGLPLSCCIAYLLAGPVINVVVLLSTWVAFSGMEKATNPGGGLSYQMGSVWMTGLRAGLAFVVAVVTAHIVEWLHHRHGNKLLMPLAMPVPPTAAQKTLGEGEDEEDEDTETAPRRSVWTRLSNISETALHDFIDITVFLILGALLAATVRQAVTQETIADVSREHPILSIALMMGLAVILVLCSEADAFVAASFTTLRPAAKLSFLVLGPMVDLKLYLMYTRVFRPRLIYTVFVAVIVQVFVYSYVVHLLWERYAPLWMTPATPGS
jgi:uncharacterized membrane protein YraQ (UPF0718 family)